ncbi:PEBP-like protein [Fomitiporia mediterranea MF3/22]|uniref:PEBP-like protein n=1 Tax=Fomitiporia mediterranea (strain MF3/22) TaxID=694068 RepID=UPI0004409648|nr:PEBP-like protein [Fomitiporia mediterranea MF3/22]EJC98052.1 PEBP-like protein [Fomitiporia mediterranea MF3/22]
MKYFKSLTSLLSIASLALFTFGQDTSLDTVVSAFNDANIPANASITFDPTTLLEVSFPQASGPQVNVTAGVQLPRNQTAIPPVFGILNASSTVANETFVVAMVDLDAPTPQDPSSAQIRHFLGGNFVAGPADADGLQLLSNSTPALSEFQQPTPPAGSDPHRYVFLLFDQPADFNNQTEVNSTTSIANFNISQFALDVGLGNPLGGTFILVGPDPSTST